MENKKITILVMGKTGVGKSTLINSVLKKEVALESMGGVGTKKMDIYEDESLSFRLIDTMGFELKSQNRRSVIQDIKKYMRVTTKKEDLDKCIDVIWYCTAAVSSRIEDTEIEELRKICKMWSNIPMIFVITKAYSEEEYISFRNELEKKISEKNPEDFNIFTYIPVVSKDYMSSNLKGIDNLIETTNQISEMAFANSKKAMKNLDLKMKINEAHKIVVFFSFTNATVGAIPIPFADSPILVFSQTMMINKITNAFGIPFSKDKISSLVKTLMVNGPVSTVAKNAVSYLKAIPGINVVGSAINAIVASAVTAALGEATIKLMKDISEEKVEKKDLEKINEYLENNFNEIFEENKINLPKLLADPDTKVIGKKVVNIFNKK